MGERKVPSHYFAPDFDPSKVKRAPKRKAQQLIRFAIPISCQCLTCGEFLPFGRKTNAFKETVQGETYLGVKVFRFRFKCTACAAPVSIKTNPKLESYDCESGAKALFNRRREMMEDDEAAREDEAEIDGDAMRKLENKTHNMAVEMDLLDALDEHRARNAENNNLSIDDVLAAVRQRGEGAGAGGAADTAAATALEDDEDDEAIVKNIQFKSARADDDAEDAQEFLAKRQQQPSLFAEMRRAKQQQQEQRRQDQAELAGLAALGDYGSGSDDD